MSGEICTESAMATARLAASDYIVRISLYTFGVTLLVLCAIGWKILPYLTTRAFNNFMYPIVVAPLTCELAPGVMDILVHTGLQLGGLELIPQILPNVCEMARIVEEKDEVWPCARDEILQVWRSGRFEVVGRGNLVVGMCLRGVWTGAFWLANSWAHNWLSAREMEKLRDEMVQNEEEGQGAKNCCGDGDQGVEGAEVEGKEDAFVQGGETCFSVDEHIGSERG